MEKITLGKDENGKLSYTTSRGGKMFDITKELRAKAIDLEEMTKKVKPVYKSLYVIRHKMIVPMARLEDDEIDLIYLNRHTKHAIFVPPRAEVTWNGKKI
tara:strand:- start:13 stop:312 length:300 start_codon:yes stop_codon:yes gene_type:complete